jgi:uncharacterized membrane protein required for colicin V production
MILRAMVIYARLCVLSRDLGFFLGFLRTVKDQLLLAFLTLASNRSSRSSRSLRPVSLEILWITLFARHLKQ